MTALLEVQNLHKSYGSLKVTEDISFSINRGEALGVIGPNGAGKSTLFNLIAGGIRPDSGTVLFNGLDVTNFHLHERSIKGIGRSFQIPHPFGGMTVFENLLVGASFSAKLKGQDADQIKSKTLGKALKALSLYGIDNIFIQESSLEERSIAQEDLILEAKILNQNELKALIKGSDSVISL